MLEKPPQRENSWIEWESPVGEAELTLYINGAGNSQGAGYGFVAFESNRLCHSEKGPLERICPYEAELYAIRAALNWLVSKPQRLKDNGTFTCDNVHRQWDKDIYTDSKSVEMVLKSSKVKSTVVQLVMNLIVKVNETCSFDSRWIKGHSGTKGQELAYCLAKEAAGEKLKDVKHYVQCKTAKNWQLKWQSHMGAANNFIQVVNPNKIKHMKKMSKKNLGVIFQSITSHGVFGHHIRKWKKDID